MTTQHVRRPVGALWRERRRLSQLELGIRAEVSTRHLSFVETDRSVPGREMLLPPVNVLRLSLHPDGLAPRIANLGEWRAHLLGRLSRQAAHAADPDLTLAGPPSTTRKVKAARRSWS